MEGATMSGHPTAREVEEMLAEIMSVFEIAKDKAEALWLAEDGFGYLTRAEAKLALQAPEIDDYYRQQLNVYEVEDGKAKRV